MNTIRDSTESARPGWPPYAVRREPGVWQLPFVGQPARFQYELRALDDACRLQWGPPELLHAAARAGDAGPISSPRQEIPGLGGQSRVGRGPGGHFRREV